MSAKHTSGRTRRAARREVDDLASVPEGAIFDERLLQKAEANDGCERFVLLSRVARTFTRALPPGFWHDIRRLEAKCVRAR